MARTKKQPEAGDVSGLALVDIPLIEAKCGEYVVIPAELAAALEADGQFDPKAPAPQ